MVEMNHKKYENPLVKYFHTVNTTTRESKP